MKENITQRRLKELLNYDAVNGIFTYAASRHGVSVGGVASAQNVNGYIRLQLDKRRYYAHRLAWLYIYGVMPDGEIDHADHVRTNNAISNLSCKSHADNMRNKRMTVCNTSGYTGVSWCKTKKKWVARITLNGKQKNLGGFVEFSAAKSARDLAQSETFFHKNHGRN